MQQRETHWKSDEDKLKKKFFYVYLFTLREKETGAEREGES